MADNIMKPARARMWKRIAIVAASISSVVLVVFVVIALLPHGNGNFTVRIDRPASQISEKESFRLSPGKPNGSNEYEYAPADTLIGDPLDSMDLSRAEDVENHLAGLENKIGQQDFVEERTDKEGNVIAKIGRAFVYTTFLVNESDHELADLCYSVNLDSYKDTESRSILSYFRILAQTEVVGSGEVKNTYYGEASHRNGYTNALNNNREPISTFKRDWDANSSKTVTSTFSSDGNDGYCQNFSDIEEDGNRALVNGIDLDTIPVEGQLRFTYVAYFEADDADSFVTMPTDSYLLLSLHFGVKISNS